MTMALTERARAVTAGGVVDVRQAHYQETKERIHRALLNRLNLDRLNRVGRAQAEPEIRGLILTLLDSESSNVPLSMSEREALITDVFHELFGLGPLEALLADPTVSDILVNRADQIYVEREGRHRTEPARVQGRPAPAAHHRAHRQLGRPAHRRVEPDGRRPPGRRLACQRDHPAAGPRRPGAVDPPLPHRPARRARPGRARVADPADARVPPRRRRLAAEHPGLGRHRRRQDDVPERALELHLGSRAHRHHRGRRRTDAAAAPRGAARDPAGQHRRQGRRSPSGSW